jgi:hypothetical protein
MRRIVTTRETLEDLRAAYSKHADYSPMTDEQLDSLPEDPAYWEGLQQQRQAFRKAASTKVARPEWEADSNINGFKTANMGARFACNCGETFEPSGFHRCGCGQSWASFIISANGDDSAVTRIVRPVHEHRERVLATRTAGWVRAAVDGTSVPSYVRHNHGQDVAPAIKQEDSAPRNEDNDAPDDKGSDDKKDDSKHENPFAAKDDDKDPKKEAKVLPVVPRLAAGGWGDPTTPGFKPDQQQSAESQPASEAPEVKTIQPGQKPYTTNPFGKGIYTTFPKVKQPKIPSVAMRAEANQYIEKRGDQWVILQKGTGDVLSHHDSEEKAESAFRAMEMNKHGGKKMTAFNEDDYRLGWALAESDSPLPQREASRSFLEGYADCLKDRLDPKTADQAPGYDTVAPAFDGQTRGVGDVLDDKKTIEDPTQSQRTDLINKLDSDNAQGQSQDSGTMADLSGWKTSALLAELARRESAAS